MRQSPRLRRWQSILLIVLALLAFGSLKLSFGLLSPHWPLRKSAQAAVVIAAVLTACTYKFLGKPRDSGSEHPQNPLDSVIGTLRQLTCKSCDREPRIASSLPRSSGLECQLLVPKSTAGILQIRAQKRQM